MDIRKNWFTYIFLTIFCIFMGYSLFSGILNIGNSTAYPFLWYGGVLLLMGSLWLSANTFAYGLSHLDLKQFHNKHRKLSNIIEIIIVAAVLSAGTALRLWIINNLPMQPSSDFETYYKVAELLDKGTLITEGAGICDYISQFPHVFGFPYVLSVVFKIAGASVRAGLYLNTAASLISIILAYLIARKICGNTGGYITLVLTAFWPSQILFINQLASEYVFTCLFLLSVLIVVYMLNYPVEDGKISIVLLLDISLGISIALAGAVRPMSIILLIALIICILPYGFKRSKKSKAVLFKSFVFKGWAQVLIILISYMISSQIISASVSKAIDRQLPGTSVSFGYNFMVGMNIESKGTWNEEDAKFLNDRFLETGSSGEAHKASIDVALKRIRENPFGAANLALEKYALLWKNDDYAAFWNRLFLGQQNNLTYERNSLINSITPWNNIYYLMCVFFSFMAGILLWNKKKLGAEHILILFFIGTAILHMLLESQNRYHFNILPVFAILAAVGITHIIGHYAKKASAPVTEPASVYWQETAETNHRTADEKADGYGGDNKFDMMKAIKDGHVIVTVTEEYVKEPEDGNKTEE